MKVGQPAPYLIPIGAICVGVLVLVATSEPNLLAWPPKNPWMCGIGVALLVGGVISLYRKKNDFIVGLMLCTAGGLFTVFGYVFA